MIGSMLVASLIGCQRECTVEISTTDVAYVVDLSWAGAADDSITYGYEHDPDRTATVTGNDDQAAARLVGLPPLTEIDFTIDSDDGSCSGSLTTNNGTPNLPSLTVSKYKPASADDWRYLTGVAMGDADTVFVIDRLGNWVFDYHHTPELISTTTVVDDGHIWYNTFDQDRTNDVGAVHRLDPTGATVDDIDTEAAHHTFSRLPDDTIAFPSIDVRDWYDQDLGKDVPVVGDRILEIAPDGTQREVFNIWDHESPTKHDHWDSQFYEQGHDWTHANAVNYSENTDSYLLSLAHMSVVYDIDRSSGDVINRFSAESITDGSTVFNFQHDPNWTDAGTLIMISYADNTASAIEYTLNADTGMLTEIWSTSRNYNGVALLGQARRLQSGNTLINYGAAGVIQEITPDKEIVWMVESELGSWFGNVDVRVDFLQ